MYVTYEIKKTIVRVIDETKQELLEKEQSSMESIYSFIKALQTLIEELKGEEKAITNICAQFGCYLKENAITTFNDAVESHLEMLLWQEKSKPSPVQDAIMKLEGMKENYQQQKNDILRVMEQSDSSSIEFISEPDMVYELQEKLFALKHNGESLREILKRIEEQEMNATALWLSSLLI